MNWLPASGSVLFMHLINEIVVSECHLPKAWFPYTLYRSLNVVDGFSQSLKFLGLWESLPVVGCLPGSLIVFHGR